MQKIVFIQKSVSFQKIKFSISEKSRL